MRLQPIDIILKSIGLGIVLLFTFADHDYPILSMLGAVIFALLIVQEIYYWTHRTTYWTHEEVIKLRDQYQEFVDLVISQRDKLSENLEACIHTQLKET
jgi:hypothetical protein